MIDAVQRLELLGAQLVISHAVLSVVGLCGYVRRERGVRVRKGSKSK